MTNLPHLDDGTTATEFADVAVAAPAARARAWARALWRAAPVFVVTICVVAYAYRWSVLEADFLRGLLVDDAYISVRHAWNLVEGHGLNFNADERIEGYTNFLYTLLLALPHIWGLALEPFVRALGALSAFAIVAITAAITRRVTGGVVAAMIALALVVDPRFVFFSLWGLETVFTCLPYLLGIYWLFQRRHAAASVAFAAAMLTRIDMVVVVAPCVAYGLADAWLSRRERPFAKSAACVVVPCTAIFGTYFATRWIYYGWMLPNTFYAKVGSPSNAWHRGAAYIEECLTAMGVAGLVYASIGAWLICGVAFVALWRRLSLEVKASSARAVTILAATAGYLGYTVLVGGDHFQERFVYHIIPLLLFSCVAPWALLGRLLGETFPGARRAELVLGAAFGGFLVVSLARAPHRFGNSDALAAWVSLGKYLKERAPVGSVLATDAAGALPFYSGLRTLDILGLANTTIAHRVVPELGSGTAGHEKADPAYIVEQRPDYISTWIDPNGGAGRGLSGVAGFDELYRLAAVVRTDMPNVTSERILSFAHEPPQSELMALHGGTGKVPGHYNWGLYVRRVELDYRAMRTADFRSSLPGWKPSVEYIVHAPRGHVPAHIMYGPFVKFSEGQHRGYVRIKTGQAEDVDPRQRLCGFDVFNGERTISEMGIYAGEARGTTADFPFSFETAPEEAAKPYEFRLYCWGLADVTVESVNVR